jgi:hypothetical protein
MDNNAFLEALSEWLKSKRDAGTVNVYCKQFHEFPAKGGHRTKQHKINRR